MNLDPASLKYLQEVVRVCRLVGIDNVAIEPKMIRGMDDDQKVVIFINDEGLAVPSRRVPEFDFGSIGLSRLGVFQTRLDIARAQDKFTIDVQAKPGVEYVQSLVMKATGTKIDYRCMDPTKIRAPKKLNDVMRFRVKLNGQVVALLQKAVVAMSADIVTLISNSEGVSFELVDVNKDVFKHTFADTVESLDDGTGVSFAHRYPVKTLISMFKEDPVGSFEIGGKGLLLFPIAGIDVYLLPQQ